MAKGKLTKKASVTRPKPAAPSLPSPPVSPTPSFLRPSRSQAPLPTTTAISIGIDSFDFENPAHEPAGRRASSTRAPREASDGSNVSASPSSASPALFPSISPTYGSVIDTPSAASSLRAKLSSDDMARTFTEHKELGVGKLRKRRPRTTSLEADDAASTLSYGSTEVDERDDRLDMVLETPEPVVIAQLWKPDPVTTMMPASTEPSSSSVASFVLLGPRISLTILNSGITTTMAATKAVVTLPLTFARHIPVVRTLVSPQSHVKEEEEERTGGIRQVILDIAELGMCSALIATWAVVAVKDIVTERMARSKVATSFEDQ